MRIGVISNTDSFIPFAYTLAAQQLQVYVFFSPPKDAFVHQKVLAFVKQAKLSFTEETNANNDLYHWLQGGNYDICFILGYPHLIRLDRLIKCPTLLFNIHFGPLPGFRGPVPVFWQLKNGIDKIGLSIHKLSSKFDAGPVVWAKETNDLPHYNYQLVNKLFSQLCIEGVFYILQLLAHRMPIPEIDTSKLTSAYHKRPVLSDVLINWQIMSSVAICNLVRACNPWNKGALTSFNGQEIKLIDATIVTQASNLATKTKPGTIVEAEHRLLIYCKDDNLININMLFYNECFIPGYQCKYLGLNKDTELG
ncbi:methionyl-tRNA formyltransferase [Mucilaginibacter paludis]|uniref:Formyl transferase domain protein n=1 Tax=Mucilaginibacter paludis DSM 18603 TaxID=714943 RepID=H1Y2B9_9SPHI|nr:formyltransferase family protein [Mucilaginibacter paludis]EHQ27899.1 formyl transferase domain protein [Mucilaginibacter paludis DSM 18603]